MKFEYLLLYFKFDILSDLNDDEDNLDLWDSFILSRSRYENIQNHGLSTYISNIDDETTYDLFFTKETDIELKNYDNLTFEKCSLIPAAANNNTSNILKNQMFSNIIVTSKVWEEHLSGSNFDFLIGTSNDFIYAQFPGVSYNEDSDVLSDEFACIPFEKGGLSHYTRAKRLRNTKIHRIFEFEYASDPEYQFSEFQLTENIDTLPLLLLQDDLKDLKYLKFLKNSNEMGPLPRKDVPYGEFLFGSEFNSKLDEKDIAFFIEQDRKIAKLHKMLDKELSDPDRDVELFSTEFLFDIDKEESLSWLQDSSDFDIK